MAYLQETIAMESTLLTASYLASNLVALGMFLAYHYTRNA